MTNSVRRGNLFSSSAAVVFVGLSSSVQLATAASFKELLYRDATKTTSQDQTQSLASSLFNELPPSLDSLPNNSLFTYWRPKAHFIAPNVRHLKLSSLLYYVTDWNLQSWQNDPMNMWVDRADNGTLTWHVG